MKKIILVGFLLLLLTGCMESTKVIDESTKPVNVTNDIIIKTDNTSVEIVWQDQHTEIIDLKLGLHVGNITLLANTNIGDRKINVTTASIPTILNGICLKDINGVAFYQAEIVSIIALGGDVYELTLDSPLDFNFSTGDFGCLLNTNLAVDGSVNPVIFSVSPKYLHPDIEWDITRLIMACGGEGISPVNYAPDDSDFMVGESLTNGIVIRSVNGVYKNIFNAKANGELRSRTGDVVYTEKSKNGLYSVSFTREFSGLDKNGVVVRLIAGYGDEFQIIVQDDLTNNLRCQAIIQGHVTNNFNT